MAQLFLNNFETQFIAAVKDAPVTGTPATELDYGVLRVSDGAAGTLINPTGGDFYALTAYKRSGTVESNVEIIHVLEVDNSTPGECRIRVLRGQEGTPVRAYVSGDRVSLRLTAGAVNGFVQSSDSRLTDSRTPTGTAGGVLSGTYPNPGFAVDMATQAELDIHANNTSNPHAVTKAQVGLGNVDNTSDLSKPISTATQTALNGKANTTHTHAIADVTGLQTALDGKQAAGSYVLTTDTRLTNSRTPTGAAGGVLSGTYPNPGFAVDMATQAELDAIAAAKANVSHAHVIADVTGLQTALDGKASTASVAAKQDTLVSGTNIKTVNSTSLLGSGNLEIPSGGVPVKGLIYAGFNSATYVDSFGAKWLKTGVAVPSTPEIQTGLSGLALTQLPFRTYLPSVITGVGGLSAYGNSKYITVCTTANTRASAYSADGTYWTYKNTLVYGTPVDLTFGGGKFVCLKLGTTNNVMYSTDGLNWTEATIPGTSATWQAITYGNDRFVAVAKNSNEAAYSLDGVTWTVTTLPRNAEWIDITWVSSGTFLALDRNSSKTTNSIIAKSTDGITWTLVSGSSSNVVSSCLAPINDYEVFFFQENSTYIGYYYIANSACSEGHFNMGILRTVASVCFGNGIFFAPLKDSNEYLTITATYSPTVTARKFSGTYFSGPCYGPSGFVIGSPTVGEILHSPDAVTTQNVLFGVPDSTSGLSSYVRYA